MASAGERTTAAAARLRRPSTIVCVVGEFKQGKSSLVNGLLGRTVCPVDDDLATAAITLVRHGDPAGAVARRRGDDGSAVNERVAIEDLGSWVSEAGNPGNEKRVERLDVTVPSPVLAQGLALGRADGRNVTLNHESRHGIASLCMGEITTSNTGSGVGHHTTNACGE